MTAPNYLTKFWETLFRPTPPWRAIIGLVAFILLCFIAGAGKVLVLLYPFLSLLTAVYLYFKAPDLYVGFTFWQLFVGSFIRRGIDYQAGMLTPGPWNFVAVLVSFVSVLTLLDELPKFFQYRSYQRAYLPFILCFSCYFYATLNGLTRNSLDAVAINCLFFIAPLSFGFYLFVNWRKYPELKRVTESSFLWGVIVLGIYGIWQFLTAPAWDRFWMIAAQTVSFGTPEPLGIRTMSTMSSPQAFASVMMAGLVLITSQRKNQISFPTSIIGYLTFLLSRARAGWFSFVVGILFFTASLKIKEQIRFIFGILVLVLVLSQLIYIEPFSSIILERFSTLSDSENDVSLNARKEIFEGLISLALREVTGLGIGTDSSWFGGRDGSILPSLFIFGWIGLLFFLSGLALLLVRIISQSSASNRDRFSNATLSITIAMLAQAGFNFIFLSSIGTVFWSFLGITLASQKYHLYLQHQQRITQDISENSTENQPVISYRT